LAHFENLAFSHYCFQDILKNKRQDTVLMDDKDFDPSSSNYEVALQRLVESYKEEASLTEEEAVALHKDIQGFNKHPLGRQLQPPRNKPGAMWFPVLAYQIAKHWRGNHTKPLNEQILDTKAKTAVQCLTTVTDPRILVSIRGNPVCSIFFHNSNL
jgi:hypothetical protein